MRVDPKRRAKDLASAAPQGESSLPHRILVVDDEPSIRQLLTASLTRAGYRVDAAEDGALAWEALQVRHYDLMITDNSMPNITGIALVKKLRGQSSTLPVVMASGTIPTDELQRHPWLGINAVLIKPFTMEEMLNTIKKALRVAVPMALLLFSLRTNGEEAAPKAVAVSVVGQCEYSQDGLTFTTLEAAHHFQQGDVIRTGEDGQADLFFRRTGTIVRLQHGTQMRIEKMTATMKEGVPLEHTLLDLRAGRIFVVVRSVVEGSTLEIRNAAGRSVVEGSGVGRYIITADGTHVSAAGSVIPLKLIGENGITIIAAGQQFTPKDGKMLPASADLWVKDLIQLDELEASTHQTVSAEAVPKP